MPDKTDNHELNLWPDDHEGWQHRSDMDAIEERLVVRDLEATRDNYTPHDGAIFVATDTGTVYDGDGTNWNLADRAFQGIETDSIGSNEEDDITLEDDIDGNELTIENYNSNAITTHSRSYRSPITKSTAQTVRGDHRNMLQPPLKQPSQSTIVWQMDDGWENNYTQRDVWDEADVTPELAINSGRIGDENKLSWQQLEELHHDLGWPVHNHGWTHADFDEISRSEIEDEVIKGEEYLLEHGIEPEYYIYSFGSTGGDLGISIVSQLYSHARGTTDSPIGMSFGGNVRYSGKERAPWRLGGLGADDEDLSYIEDHIDQAIDNDTSLIIYSHNIIEGDRDDEGGTETSTEKIKHIADYARDEGARWGTMAEALAETPQWSWEVPGCGRIFPNALNGNWFWTLEGSRLEFEGDGVVRLPRLSSSPDPTTAEIYYHEGNDEFRVGLGDGEYSIDLSPVN